MTQAQALKIMKTGVNVYLTGSAGAGKTYVLNEYIKYCKEHEINVAVTASTGIAATHMNGQTIHGWAGIGIKDEISEYDIEALLEKQYLHKRFRDARVLIIDEVSMLHAHRLDIVEKVCRNFKGNGLPFGGLQVILCGDFFQLPPITRGRNADDGNIDDMIIYSKSWKVMSPAICYITEQHRQEDETFTDILNNFRKDSLNNKHIEIIKERLNAKIENILPTKLYTHNMDVDQINNTELGKIKADEREYFMSSKGGDVLVEILKKSCLAHETLRLRVGAQVMFIKNNFERGYVNGTRGIVKRFYSDGTPVVETLNGELIDVIEESWAIEENDKVKASISQLPLRLAWAITIHKSQGMSLDSAEIDLSKTFAFGMGYVALSRVRTLAGIRLVGFHENSLKINPRILEIDENLKEESYNNEVLFGKLSNDEQIRLEEKFILNMGGTLVPDGNKTNKKRGEKVSTIEITKKYVEEGKTIKQIATIREIAQGTVIGHLEELVKLGYNINLPHLRPVNSKHIDLVKKYSKGGDGTLTFIKIALQKAGQNMSFDEIRLARLFI